MGFRHYIRLGTRQRLLRGERVNWVMNRDRWKYIRAIIISSPPWLTPDDKRDIKLLAQWCKVMEIMTGKEYSLDHHVPVNHPNVCGLTVPWNLQVIPSLSNTSKGNRFNPDQQDLFGPIESIRTCGIA